MTGKPLHADREGGFVLLQVVFGGVVMLALLLTGFQTVRSTIQLTNTVATSNDFKDYMLAVEQELATSESCMGRLGLAPGTLLSTVTAPADGYPVKVNDITGIPMAWEEGTAGGLLNPPTGRSNPRGFKVKEIRLRNLSIQGWTSGVLPGAVPGTQELERYTGTLTIVGERRSEFIGSTEMRGSVPILFGVKRVGFPAVLHIQNCTAREIYRVQLGPPGVLPAGVTRKSGAECIDRGGMPVLAAGQAYYLCAIPTSAWAVCDTTGSVNAGNNNLPGWYCAQATPASGAGLTYVY